MAFDRTLMLISKPVCVCYSSTEQLLLVSCHTLMRVRIYTLHENEFFQCRMLIRPLPLNKRFLIYPVILSLLARLLIPPPHNTCLSRPSDKVLHSCTEWDRNGRSRTCNLALVVFKRILAALPLSYVPLMPVFPGCHSVFIRTLPRYLTLPLRRAPTCHENGREPDELTEHHRAESS